MARARLPRPAHFDASNQTVLDPDYLPRALRDELRAMIPGGADWGALDAFMYECGIAAQSVFSMHGCEPPAESARRLREFETRCHALAAAMHALRPDELQALHGVADSRPEMWQDWPGKHESMGELSSPYRLSAAGNKYIDGNEGHEFTKARFTALFDAAQDWEAVAEFAARTAEGISSRQRQPRILAARQLAYYVVRAHWNSFGTWPPIGDGWFQALVARLGEHCGLLCGVDLVNDGIKQRKRDTKRATSD